MIFAPRHAGGIRACVRNPAIVVLFSLVTSACSTTYRFSQEDVERIAAGREVRNVKDNKGGLVDLGTYSLVYREKDSKAPKRVKGLEQLNSLATGGQLAAMQKLEAVPGLADKAAQRVALGGGVGLAAGVGIGFAISNRIAIEQQRDQALTVALGTVISGLLGATAGALIAYFGGAGVGNMRDGSIELTEGSASLPASEPASQPSH
jgi:hypothetical protein